MCECELAKVLGDGKLTIPKAIRKELDVIEGDTIIFEQSKAGIVIKKGMVVPASKSKKD